MTGDLVRYQPQSSIELAPEAWSLAQRIAQTPFVPKGLQGKPESVLAAMLTGNELGIGVMQALAKIHVIEGRPAISAELMRALVIRDGHELWIEELSNSRCTVVAQRAGSERQQRFTWTLDDAKSAQLSGKDNWRKYPRAMLLARATGEACRAVFPDLLAGMSYTSEELTDGGVVHLEDLQAAAGAAPTNGATKPVRKVRAARAATAPAEPAPAAPPLPGEDDDVDDAEVVEDYEGPDTHSQHEARPLTPEAAIAVRLKDLGVTDRDTKLALVAAIVGHPVASTKDLTVDEVRQVLETISQDAYQLPAAVGEEDGASPARRRRAVSDPERFTALDWEEICRKRGVEVSQLLAEAQRLARDVGEKPPATTDDIGGKGLAAHLLHWAEQ